MEINTHLWQADGSRRQHTVLCRVLPLPPLREGGPHAPPHNRAVCICSRHKTTPIGARGRFPVLMGLPVSAPLANQTNWTTPCLLILIKPCAPVPQNPAAYLAVQLPWGPGHLPAQRPRALLPSPWGQLPAAWQPACACLRSCACKLSCDAAHVDRDRTKRHT